MFSITKYHKTEAGEACSSVKCNDEEEALSLYYGFAKAYTDDKSVRVWGLSIQDVSEGTMKVIKRDNRIKPAPETDAGIME